MKNKITAPPLLWGLLTLLLLALAFLGPRLLLAWEQAASLEANFQLDASAYLLETAPGDYLKKLQSLSGQFYESIPLRTENVDLALARGRAVEELERLEDLGLLPRGFSRDVEASEATMSVGRFCAVNQDLGTMLEIYQIESSSRPLVLTVDKATWKVLQLSFTDLNLAYTDGLLAECGNTLPRRVAQAWADYYGLPLLSESGQAPEELGLILETRTNFDMLPQFCVLQLGTESDFVELVLDLRFDSNVPAYFWRPE